MDTILLTLINATACLALPKLLSLVLVRKSKQSPASSIGSNLQTTKLEITSFPYCTTYTLTGRQSCKFSPHFCSQCSPK
jgi:hypothetical protein